MEKSTVLMPTINHGSKYFLNVAAALEVKKKQTESGNKHFKAV